MLINFLIEKKFLLKDRLFNRDKVQKIANEIKVVYPDFSKTSFINKVLEKFPELELLERVFWIRYCLREFLPKDYRVAVKIILESLPPPCSPTLTDDDFGDFIYSPYSFFISEYGCSENI